MTKRITIRKPDDWHLHVRDGAMMKAVLPFTARHFGRAIIMPNLVPPVTSVDAAIAYRERLMACLPPGSTFQPLMTCYLTDHTDPDEVERGSPVGERLARVVQEAATRAGLAWREASALILRRGPYVVAAGLDESIGGAPRRLEGRWVNLFDPELRLQRTIELSPGTRAFLLDLEAVQSPAPRLLASAGKALEKRRDDRSIVWTVEGVGGTPAIVLAAVPRAPRSVRLDQQPLDSFAFDPDAGLLRIRFPNEARPRELSVGF